MFPNNVAFNYRIVQCRDFCKYNGGWIYAKHDKQNNILAIMFGDISICVIFDDQTISNDFSFFGLENYFQMASNNNGKEKEKILDVPVDKYKNAKDKFVQYGKDIVIKQESNTLDFLWQKTGRNGVMPQNMKKEFIQMLHDENVRLGERQTNERIAEIFNQFLDKFGF